MVACAVPEIELTSIGTSEFRSFELVDDVALIVCALAEKVVTLFVVDQEAIRVGFEVTVTL